MHGVVDICWSSRSWSSCLGVGAGMVSDTGISTMGLQSGGSSVIDDTGVIGDIGSGAGAGMVTTVARQTPVPRGAGTGVTAIGTGVTAIGAGVTAIGAGVTSIGAGVTAIGAGVTSTAEGPNTSS